MRNVRLSSLLLVLAVSAACAPESFPGPTTAADPVAVEGWIRLYQTTCKREFDSDNTPKNKKLRRNLHYFSMSSDTFCKCFGREFMNSISQKEFDQLARDVADGKASTRESWKTRGNRATRRCLADSGA